MAAELTAGSQTLDRALRILIQVGEHGAEGLTLADCTALLGFSKPTTHRILRTLASRGFLRLDPKRGVYTLGVANLRLGMAFLEQLDLRAEALSLLRELADRTGETVHLGILDGSDVVYIEKVESRHPVRMFSHVGRTMPAYSTGVGKAILAYLPSDQLESAVPARLEARTPATITDKAQLIRHLGEVRGRGYSIDDVENEDGIRCVGAPIFDHTAAVRAGISVAGPETRVTVARAPELGALVRETALAVSRRIGFVDEPSLAGVGA